VLLDKFCFYEGKIYCFYFFSFGIFESDEQVLNKLIIFLTSGGGKRKSGTIFQAFSV